MTTRSEAPGAGQAPGGSTDLNGGGKRPLPLFLEKGTSMHYSTLAVFRPSAGCPWCGGTLTRRQNYRTGERFLACVYRDCSYTMAYDADRQHLARLYAIPNSLTSLEAWQRYIHADLLHLSLEALEQQFQRLHLRLLLDESPHPWLSKREDALLQAIATRRSGLDLPQQARPPQPQEGATKTPTPPERTRVQHPFRSPPRPSRHRPYRFLGEQL